MTSENEPKLRALDELLSIITRLRAPDGCPWDRKQTEQSMATYVLEEAYETVDAIRVGEGGQAGEEIGDLLMVLLMICRISEESGGYDVAEACRSISTKLVRRHPHVFGETEVSSADEVVERWEDIKQIEKQEKGAEDTSALAGVPKSLPALIRAYRVGEKAASVGFEWPDRHGPEAKIREELDELLEVADHQPPGDPRIAEELGDLLFAVVNLARHLKVDPEIALRGTMDRFSHRFRYVETHLGKPAREATLQEMEDLWQEAKQNG